MYHLILTTNTQFIKLLHNIKRIHLMIFLGIIAVFASSIPTYAEDTQVKWIIEDQPIIVEPKNESDIIEFNVFGRETQSDKEQKKSDVDEKSVKLKISILEHKDGDYVSGSLYNKDDLYISPTSPEGMKINELLIEQKQHWKENWLHKIKYWDRFGDGYIVLAEAMLEPVDGGKYVVGGMKFDENPNSNLAHYLRERGYDINNPSSIPNDVFAPVMYEDARNMLAKISDTEDGIDLRELDPYYNPLTEQDIEDILIEDIEKHSIAIQDNILDEMTTSFESERAQSPELVQRSPKQDIIRMDDSIFETNIENKFYQNTEFISDVSFDQKDIAEFEDNLTHIFAVIIAAVFLAIIGYVILKKKKENVKQIISITDSAQQVNVAEQTFVMIDKSIQLLDAGKKKEAHEKLSHAIRFYYSNKSGITKEIDTTELIQILKRQNLIEYDVIKSWLKFCSLVEFAKQDIHDIQFRNIISAFRGKIK